MGQRIGLAYINDIERDRRGPPAPELVAQLAAVLGVPLEVLQFYAGRLPAEASQERRDLTMNISWRPIARFVRSYRKSEETDHERAHFIRAPARSVYFTREQLDERCEKIVVGFFMERYGLELIPVPTEVPVARKTRPRRGSASRSR